MRVTWLVSTLRAGGAERVITRLANARAAAGQPTSVITLDSAATDFYTLDPRVQRTALGLLAPSRHAGDAALATVRRVAALRRAVAATRPDVVVSFVDQMNVLALAAGAGSGIPHVVSERIDPRECSPGRVWAAGRRLLYPTAAAVVVQTRDVAAWAGAAHPAWKTALIPNPVDVPSTPGRDREQLVVGMGRLVPQKGFDLLIDAFAGIAAAHPGWRLCIAGEGPEQPALLARAAAAGIADRVALPGVVSADDGLLSRAGVFALSSRFEGFPNVLLEAMAAGCAVAAFDCPSGPADIIEPATDGLLVPAGDVRALSAALDRLMRSTAERERLGHAARRVAHRFSLESISEQWERLFASVVR